MSRYQTPDAAELPDASRGGPISQYNPYDIDALTSVDVQRALETNNVGLLHDWVERLRARTRGHGVRARRRPQNPGGGGGFARRRGQQSGAAPRAGGT